MSIRRNLRREGDVGKGAKNQKHGEYVSIWGEGPQCLWVWPDTGVAHYTWDKVNLGFGRVALRYRGMRTGVPQILLNEDRGSSNAPGEGSVFFESFFRLIFEFLTNSVLQCVVKKAVP